MRPAEEGLLLLCCALGTQDVPLTPAQYRTLARRVRQTCQAGDGEVTPAYLRALGYPEAAALQITALLDRTDTLHRYLEAAAAQGITALTRLSDGFPARLRRMGETECPPARHALRCARRLAAAPAGYPPLCCAGRKARCGRGLYARLRRSCRCGHRRAGGLPCSGRPGDLLCAGQSAGPSCAAKRAVLQHGRL